MQPLMLRIVNVDTVAAILINSTEFPAIPKLLSNKLLLIVIFRFGFGRRSG